MGQGLSELIICSTDESIVKNNFAFIRAICLYITIF